MSRITVRSNTTTACNAFGPHAGASRSTLEDEALASVIVPGLSEIETDFANGRTFSLQEWIGDDNDGGTE